MASSQPITVTPITPSIGAEIGNIDLREQLSGEAISTVKRAFADHHVLVFRDQALTREQHKTFGRVFGELHIHPSKRSLGAGGDPEIFTVKTDDQTVKNNGGRWHMDVSCEEIPPLGSLLLLSEGPPNGGDTLFANMHLAYEQLSTPIKEMLLGLDAHHDGLRDLRWYGFEPKPGQTYPAHTHPVVAQHPDSRRPLLMVNEGFTSRIEGLAPDESDALLQMLFNRVAGSPQIQCRVQWQPGTLTMWDNRCVQHFAVWDYAPHHRRGERVSVCGTTAPQPARAAQTSSPAVGTP